VSDVRVYCESRGLLLVLRIRGLVLEVSNIGVNQLGRTDRARIKYCINLMIKIRRFGIKVRDCL
jgi:hypothetical protein